MFKYLLVILVLLNSMAIAERTEDIKIIFDKSIKAGNSVPAIFPTVGCAGDKYYPSKISLEKDENGMLLRIGITGQYKGDKRKTCSLTTHVPGRKYAYDQDVYFTINNLKVGFTDNNQYHTCTIGQKIGLSDFYHGFGSHYGQLEAEYGSYTNLEGGVVELNCSEDNGYKYVIYQGMTLENPFQGEIMSGWLTIFK